MSAPHPENREPGEGSVRGNRIVVISVVFAALLIFVFAFGDGRHDGATTAETTES